MYTGSKSLETSPLRASVILELWRWSMDDGRGGPVGQGPASVSDHLRGSHGSSNPAPASPAVPISAHSQQPRPRHGDTYWSALREEFLAFLTGSRFAHKLFAIRQVSTQILAPENLRKTPTFSDFSAFLPGSAKYIENDVTYSKQTTGEFLPGATTTRFRLAAQLTNRYSNSVFRALRKPLIALIQGGKL